MSDTFSSQLIREMENALDDKAEEESPFISVKYAIISGLRGGSEIMWAHEEKQLYYRNSTSRKTLIEGYDLFYVYS